MWAIERIKRCMFNVVMGRVILSCITNKQKKIIHKGVFWGLVALCLHANVQGHNGEPEGWCKRFLYELKWGQQGEKGEQYRQDLIYGKRSHKKKDAKDDNEGGDPLKMEDIELTSQNYEKCEKDRAQANSGADKEEQQEMLDDADQVIFDAIYRNLRIPEGVEDSQECKQVVEVIKHCITQTHAILPLTDPSHYPIFETVATVFVGSGAAILCPFNSLFISNLPLIRKAAAAAGTVPLSIDFTKDLMNALKLGGLNGVIKRLQILKGNPGEAVLCVLSFFTGLLYAISDAQSAFLAGSGPELNLPVALSALIAAGNGFFTGLAGMIFFYYGTLDFLNDMQKLIFLVANNYATETEEGKIKLACLTMNNPKIEETKKFKRIGKFYNLLLGERENLLTPDELQYRDLIRKRAEATVTSYIMDDLNVKGFSGFTSLIADAKSHYDVDYPLRKSFYKVFFGVEKSEKGEFVIIVLKWALIAWVVSVAMPGNVNVFAGKRLTKARCEQGLIYYVLGEDANNARIYANPSIGLGTNLGSDMDCCGDFVKSIGKRTYPSGAAFACARIEGITGMNGKDLMDIMTLYKTGDLPNYLLTNGASKSAVKGIMQNLNSTMVCEIIDGKVAKGCGIDFSQYIPPLAGFTAEAGGWTQGLALSLMTLVTGCGVVRAVMLFPLAYKEMLKIHPSDCIFWVLGMATMGVCLYYYDLNILGTSIFGEIMYNVMALTNDAPSVNPKVALFTTTAILTVPFSAGGESIACAYKYIIEGKAPREEYVQDGDGYTLQYVPFCTRCYRTWKDRFFYVIPGSIKRAFHR